MSESFEFVFPDSSCTENNGGFDNIDEMKQTLLELKSKGHEFMLSFYSTNNLLSEFDSHTFKKAFPKMILKVTNGSWIMSNDILLVNSTK